MWEEWEWLSEWTVCEDNLRVRFHFVEKDIIIRLLRCWGWRGGRDEGCEDDDGLTLLISTTPHPLTHSLTHSPLTHSLTQSPTHPLTHSLTLLICTTLSTFLHAHKVDPSWKTKHANKKWKNENKNKTKTEKKRVGKSQSSHKKNAQYANNKITKTTR